MTKAPTKAGPSLKKGGQTVPKSAKPFIKEAKADHDRTGTASVGLGSTNKSPLPRSD